MGQAARTPERCDLVRPARGSRVPGDRRGSCRPTLAPRPPDRRARCRGTRRPPGRRPRAHHSCRRADSTRGRRRGPRRACARRDRRLALVEDGGPQSDRGGWGTSGAVRVQRRRGVREPEGQRHQVAHARSAECGALGGAVRAQLDRRDRVEYPVPRRPLRP